MVRLSIVVLFGLLVSGCATYQYAQNVKMVSFSDNVEKGTSVGNIRGEDCTWNILGYQLGGAPTVDRALMHAKNGTDGASLKGSLTTNQQATQRIRYINNVHTENGGFNAGVLAKQCIVVTGVGYQ